MLTLPLVSAGLPLQSWVFTKGQGKGALTPSPASESPESTVIEVEDIPALLRDVARFAEAVDKLKDVVLAEGDELSHRTTFGSRLFTVSGGSVSLCLDV